MEYKICSAKRNGKLFFKAAVALRLCSRAENPLPLPTNFTLWPKTAADKGEVQEALNQLMALPGMQAYVVINFDGKWNFWRP